MNILSMGLYLHPQHWAQMEADVRLKTPEEACGFVAGEGNRARLVIPVTNILHSPFRFRMEPQEQLSAFLLAEDKGLDILAVYHSHPQGIYQPSVTDREELTYPDIIYLIWFEQGTHWQCLGYLLDSKREIREVSVTISDGT